MSNTIKRLRIPVAVLVVSLVFGFILSSSLINSQDKSEALGSCGGLRVCITEKGITPNEISVKVGETVQFINADGKTHNMGIGGGSGDDQSHGHDHSQAHEHEGAYASGDFKKGENWQVTFNGAGTFRLHDHYEPENNILIVVYEPTT